MSNNLALTIKLDANGNLVGLVNQATGSVAKFGETVNGVTAKTKALGIEGEKAFGKTRAGVESISKQLDSMRSAMGIAFNFAAVSASSYAIVSVSDAYKAMQGQLRLVTESTQEFITKQTAVQMYWFRLLIQATNRPLAIIARSHYV